MLLVKSDSKFFQTRCVRAEDFKYYKYRPHNIVYCKLLLQLQLQRNLKRGSFIIDTRSYRAIMKRNNRHQQNWLFTDPDIDPR